AELRALPPTVRKQTAKLEGLAEEDDWLVHILLLLALALSGASLGLLLLFDHRHARTEQALAEVEFHSTHDGVTGAWNRDAILDLLLREAQRAEREHLSLAVLKVQLEALEAEALETERLHAMLREGVVRISSALRSYDAMGRV